MLPLPNGSRVMEVKKRKLLCSFQAYEYYFIPILQFMNKSDFGSMSESGDF